MSRLQDLVNKLVQVIVSYNETQTSKTHPLETFLDKTPQELKESLQFLISEATKIYTERRPLLNYFLYVIEKIKPSVDKNIPLNEDEETLVSNTLITLLTNSKRLLATYQSANIAVKYRSDAPTEKMKGFIRGVTSYYSLCNTGQIIEKELFVEFNLKSINIEEFIKTLVSGHQIPLQLQSLNHLNDAEKELDSLRKKAKEIKDIADNLLTKLRIVENDLEVEKKQVALLLEEKNGVQKTLETQIKELTSEQEKTKVLQFAKKRALSSIITLQNELELEKKKNLSSQDENNGMRREVDSIKSELTIEQEKTRKLSNEVKSLREENGNLNKLIAANANNPTLSRLYNPSISSYMTGARFFPQPLMNAIDKNMAPRPSDLKYNASSEME